LLYHRGLFILDAFTQGKVIFDDIGVFNFLKNEVKYVIERSGLKRCEEGWLVKEVG